MDKYLELHCRACKSYHDEKPNYKDRFYDYLYEGQIEWLEVGHDVPSIDERVWYRSNTVPKEGKTRFLMLNAPMRWRINTNRKFLYMSALSSLNGWDSHPNEIVDSSIVECRLLRIVEQNQFEAWLEVKIESSVMVNDISNNYPVRNNDNIIDYLIYGGEIYFEYDDYMYLNTNAQGDIGAWVLIKKIKGKYRVLLLGDWSVNHDFIYVANDEISESRVLEFINKAEKLETDN